MAKPARARTRRAGVRPHGKTRAAKIKSYRLTIREVSERFAEVWR